MSGSALRSASRRLWNIRELLFSAIEKSLVAGENHLPQLREFRNVGVVRFLCDASLKFKRLSQRPFGLFGHLRSNALEASLYLAYGANHGSKAILAGLPILVSDVLQFFSH